jgi:NADH-quinone oxidoreductase subunit A
MGQYLPIVLLLALAIVFVVGSLVASSLLAPRRPHDKKRAPYECGIVPAQDTPERFPVRFFLIAMIFIVFDIEIIFFYPFTMVLDTLGAYGIIAILIFSAAVFESFLYLISKGALDWGPVKQLRRSELTSPERTASTTVRRVGLEGRGAPAGDAVEAA